MKGSPFSVRRHRGTERRARGRVVLRAAWARACPWACWVRGCGFFWCLQCAPGPSRPGALGANASSRQCRTLVQLNHSAPISRPRYLALEPCAAVLATDQGFHSQVVLLCFRALGRRFTRSAAWGSTMRRPCERRWLETSALPSSLTWLGVAPRASSWTKSGKCLLQHALALRGA